MFKFFERNTEPEIPLWKANIFEMRNDDLKKYHAEVLDRWTWDTGSDADAEIIEYAETVMADRMRYDRINTAQIQAGTISCAQITADQIANWEPPK